MNDHAPEMHSCVCMHACMHLHLVPDSDSAPAGFFCRVAGKGPGRRQLRTKELVLAATLPQHPTPAHPIQQDRQPTRHSHNARTTSSPTVEPVLRASHSLAHLPLLPIRLKPLSVRQRAQQQCCRRLCMETTAMRTMSPPRLREGQAHGHVNALPLPLLLQLRQQQPVSGPAASSASPTTAPNSTPHKATAQGETTWRTSSLETSSPGMSHKRWQQQPRHRDPGTTTCPHYPSRQPQRPLRRSSIRITCLHAHPRNHRLLPTIAQTRPPLPSSKDMAFLDLRSPAPAATPWPSHLQRAPRGMAVLMVAAGASVHSLRWLLHNRLHSPMVAPPRYKHSVHGALPVRPCTAPAPSGAQTQGCSCRATTSTSSGRPCTPTTLPMPMAPQIPTASSMPGDQGQLPTQSTTTTSSSGTAQAMGTQRAGQDRNSRDTSSSSMHMTARLVTSNSITTPTVRHLHGTSGRACRREAAGVCPHPPPRLNLVGLPLPLSRFLHTCLTPPSRGSWMLWETCHRIQSSQPWRKWDSVPRPRLMPSRRPPS